MTLLDESARFGAVFLVVSLSFSVRGGYCQLLVFPSGPTRVDARAGSNVTLAVSFSGAPDPVVTWFRGGLPVLTWTVGSSAAPDVASDNRDVLSIEADGSLSFVNVPLGYTSNYTVKMTKSGLGEAVTAFTLKLFEDFQDVELSTLPAVAKEGSDRFTLQYAMSQGVVQHQTWLFNGGEVKTSSRYSVEPRSLVILNLKRGDAGRYSVILTNPFSRASAHVNVTVLYGPEEPVLEARPAQPFYVSGDSLSLVCRADGIPPPTAEWIFGGQTLLDSRGGVLNRTNVHTGQGGVYMCKLINELTKEQLQPSMTLNVYEKPSGGPTCSVQWGDVNAALRYRCRWPGGTPPARLSFPALSGTGSGEGNFSVTVPASDTFNGKTVKCVADHPVEQNQCNITASRPAEFLPAVRTTVNSEGQIVVTIACVSEAAPRAVVSWSKGSEAVVNGTTYQISNDTARLKIHGYNISSFLQQKYTCSCRNPLGSRGRETQLQGPSVSSSSLFPNQDGTIVTLTWEVPSTSVVTGFDVQMKGPDLVPEVRNGTETRATSNEYRTIQQKPGSARSADVLRLDPDSTYRFRVVPKARLTGGEPSEVHRIGPGEGLSGPAIAGIAAGIPCSLLFLLLLAGLIYLCIYLNKNKSRQARYPVSRAVEKAITTQSEATPHNLLTGGLKSPPDYNRLQLTPSERSVALPTFVPPPPVRVATTV